MVRGRLTTSSITDQFFTAGLAASTARWYVGLLLIVRRDG
jgi:hypothetical protein